VNALLLLGLTLAGILSPGVAPAAVIDHSTFRVYQRGRALGTETFSYESLRDSLRIFSHVVQVLPGPPGPDSALAIDKQVVLVVNPFDYDLRFYQSTLRAGGRDSTIRVGGRDSTVRVGSRTLTRGLVVNDTAFTAYREFTGRGGVGDRYDRPPGRLFVLDGQVFVLFDVMCRNLHGRAFDRRPLSVILLRDEMDQVTEITATDLGTETIRWGERPVAARKLRFADSYATFQAWVGPEGYMLRLEQPASGLRVEREPAPAVKPPARRPARSTGG
jgi:hypothetical protein